MNETLDKRKSSRDSSLGRSNEMTQARRRLRGGSAALGILILLLVTARASAGGGPDALDPLPRGVGPLVIAEQGAGRITLVSSDGSKTILVDDLVNPRGVALSPDGSLIAVTVAGSSEGKGRIVTVGVDRTSTIIAKGLSYPEGIAFVDDDTLVFTSTIDQTINLIGRDGSGLEVGATIAGQPVGVTLTQRRADRAVVVVPWQGPALRFDPATGDVSPITPPVSGAGHPRFHRRLGLCVPELLQDRVVCIPPDGGAQTVFPDIEDPVAIDITPDGRLVVVSGPEGLTVVDTRTGEHVAVLGPLRNAAGVQLLGGAGDDWVDIDSPEAATPTPGGVATTGAAPAPVPSPTATVPLEASGFPWPWLLFGLLVIMFSGAAVAGAGRALALAPRPPQDPGGSVDMVPPDPCDELRALAKQARADCGSSRAETERLESDASRAEAESKTAEERRGAAERELADASKEPGPGSWIEDDEGRITQRDLELKRAASKAAWDDYKAGAIGAGELEQTWREMGERAALERLREEDRRRREERRVAAEQEMEAARRGAAEAGGRADDARRAANEAAAGADRTCAEAERLEQELAECEKRASEEYARREQARRAAGERRTHELEEREAWLASQPPVELEERRVHAPQHDDSELKVCCDSGVWVGWGGSVAGHSLVSGVDTTHLEMVCAGNPDRWVSMTCQTLRLGPGLGGHGTAVLAMAFAVHAADLPWIMQNALNGLDFDAAVGFSLKGAVKGAGQGGKIADALAKLKDLAKSKAPAGALEPSAQATVGQAGVAVRALTKGPGGKALLKGAQAEGPTGAGLVVPAGALGASAQFGVWWGISTKVWVTDFRSCGCSPPGYSRR